MNRTLRAVFWVGVYLILVAAPLSVLLAGPATPARGFWLRFAVGLGFASLGMMGMQFLLTARFGRAAEPFGTDILYYFHRYLGYLVLAVLAIHAGVFVVDDPTLLEGLAPRGLSRPLVLGVVAFLAAAALVASSVAREALGLPYEGWRALHAVLAVTAVGGGLLHALDYGAHIAPGWSRAFWILYGSGGAALLAYVRIVKPWRSRRRPWRLVENRPEAGTARTLALEPEGHGGLSYRAGQFAWLTLDDSPFAMAEHPFSFSSAPDGGTRVEFTIQPIGDFTRRAVEAEEGAVAYVEGPHGLFTVEDHPAAAYVLVAGGIGIAPIMSILRDRARRGDRRPFLLLYGTHTPERAVFRDELRALESEMTLHLVHVVEEPTEGWDGEVGLVDGDVLDRHLPDDDLEREYFLCGPVPMLDSVSRLLVNRGVPSGRIHTEVFHWV